MIINDSDKVQKLKREKISKIKQEQKIAWAKQQEADCIFVEDDLIGPHNAERQLGHPLWPKELEARLISLCPNLHFEVNSWNPSMKALYLILPDGSKDYIGAYHNELMPEHSVVKIKTEEVWDPDQTEGKVLNRKDMPKSHWVPGTGYVFEAGKRPGWKTIKKPHGELKRGWRTLLLKLVLRGLVTPTQVETTFASPTSPFGKRAWKYHTGQTLDPSAAIPW